MTQGSLFEAASAASAATVRVLMHLIPVAGAPETYCRVKTISIRIAKSGEFSTDRTVVNCAACLAAKAEAERAEAEARAAYEARRAARAAAPADLDANYDLAAGQSARLVERTDREAPAGRRCPECGGSTCPAGECMA